VRETILKYGKIEVIIDLDETQLFTDESPETIIFKFKKGKFKLTNEKIKLLNIKTTKTNGMEIYRKAIESLANRTSNELFDYKEFTHYLDSEAWSTFIIEIPKFPSVKLKEIAKVGVGLVSGFDKAFVAKEKDYTEFNINEREIIKKFVKGKNCRRFIVDGYELYIVIDDFIKSEKELGRLYPNIYQKILPYKEEMMKRYLPKNKRWFHWQALRNYSFLTANINKRRIYVPTLDRHPYNRFSLGEKGLLPSGDVLFIQPYNEEDLYFLLGYLNSTFFRKYYLSTGGRRGGRISFTQKLLENAKIPLFSEHIKEKITDTTKKIMQGIEKGENTALLEKYLDDLIYSSIEKGEFSRKRDIDANTTLEQWGIM